jgi:hypothetical protein
VSVFCCWAIFKTPPLLWHFPGQGRGELGSAFCPIQADLFFSAPQTHRAAEKGRAA